MQVRTFLGKIEVTIGEYTNNVSLLVVANSEESAQRVLSDAAESYYAGTAIDGEAGFESHGGEVCVTPFSLNEIGLATYLDLKQALRTCFQDNVTVPETLALGEAVRFAASQLTNAFASKGIVAKHSQVLEALAASWGQKGWQVLKAKLDTPHKALLLKLLKAAQDVVQNADNEGCSDDLTVTSAGAVERMDELLDEVREVLKK